MNRRAHRVDPSCHGQARPTAELGDAHAREAREAAELLVHDLQMGWDGHDAAVADRRLAVDVLWGSPFGASVRGYDRLHEIHKDLKRKSVGGASSRFEIVECVAPAPGVALAQVRRTAIDAEGRALPAAESANAAFSELALYVLVKRGDCWWVCAAQNTSISTTP
jgi:hypothetical protein